MSSKETLGRMSVSTRPVRSPNFSPSFAKTSSIRRCSAQRRSSASSFDIGRQYTRPRHPAAGAAGRASPMDSAAPASSREARIVHIEA